MAIHSVVAIIMVPFLLAHVGKQGYGLVGILGVIVSIAGVTDLGLRGALGRELTEQVARHNHERFNQIASTAFLLYLTIGSMLAFAGWVLAPWFVTQFKVAPEFQTEAIWLMRIYGTIAVYISFISPVYSASLSAYHRFDRINGARIWSHTFTSLLMFAVVYYAKNPLYGYVGVLIFGQLLGLALLILTFYKNCREVHIGIQEICPKRLKSLFHLGGYMYAFQMTKALSERADPLIVSYFFSPTGVALYQPGSKLSTMIKPVVMLLSEQMYPLTTRFHIEGQKTKLQLSLILGTRISLLMGILFSGGIIVLADNFCRLWLGPALGSDYKIVATIMQAWAIIDLIAYASGAEWPILLAMKKFKVLLLIILPTAVINVLISIYLIGYTSLGIPGVTFATVIIGVLRRPLLLCYTAKACGLAPSSYFKKAYLTPLTCLGVTLLTAYAAKAMIGPDSYPTLLLTSLITFFGWGLSCWFIGINHTERSQLISNLIAQWNHFMNRPKK